MKDLKEMKFILTTGIYPIDRSRKYFSFFHRPRGTEEQDKRHNAAGAYIAYTYD